MSSGAADAARAPDVAEGASSPPPAGSLTPSSGDDAPSSAASAADADVPADEGKAGSVVPGSVDSEDLAAASGDGLAEVEELADEISAEFSELDSLVRERDEYLDALRRLQADFENYRKRVQRQEAEASERGVADLVLRLLPVLDTVELALAHHPGDAVAQVASALEDVLFKEGLERVPGAGALFDPNEHDAVLHEEGDGPGEVVEVLRSGYRWRGRVLRAAMVKVKGS